MKKSAYDILYQATNIAVALSARSHTTRRAFDLLVRIQASYNDNIHRHFGLRPDAPFTTQQFITPLPRSVYASASA